jgi:hypothetical protein
MVVVDEISGPLRVLQAKVERIDPQLLCAFVRMQFLRDAGLQAAEATELAGYLIIGVDPVRLHDVVGCAIGADQAKTGDQYHRGSG